MKDVDLKNQIDGRNAAHDSIRSISGGVLTSLLLLLILSSSTLIEAQTPSMTPGEIYNQDLDPVLKSVEGLTIHDRIGNSLPLDSVVRLDTGEQVVLGELLKSKRPVILNLVYFSCPMLCNLVVEGLIKSVAHCGLEIGADFDVLTVSIDPRDSAKDARNRKTLLIGALEEEAILSGVDVSKARAGWHFVTGKKNSLKATADAVGFDYAWNDYNEEYAHGAGIFIVSPDGVLTQTIQGIEFDPQTLRLALVESSQGKVGNWLDQIVLTCFVYDPSKAQYGPVALKVMRLGGLGTVVGFGGYLLHLWSRKNRNENPGEIALGTQREQSQS